MANRFLLQSGGGVITLQSGGGNLLLQSDGATAGLDGGEDAGWLGLPGVILGAVALAGVIASGAAQAQIKQHQDEVPYATGNGIIYGQPYTSRAQVKPVFIQWGQGDERPTPAAAPALEESVFTPSVNAPDPVIWLPPSEDHVSPKLPEEDAFLQFTVKNEVSFSVNWPDETVSRIQVEESEWNSPVVVPQIPVAPIWDAPDEVTQTPTTPGLEESEFVGSTSLPRPVYALWNIPDDLPTPPATQGSGGMLYDEISIFRWHQEDPLPQQVVTFPPEESSAFFGASVKESPQEVSFHTDEISPKIEEVHWEAVTWITPAPVLQLWETQDELGTPSAAFTPDEEAWQVFSRRIPDADGIIWVTDDDIALAFAPEYESWWKPEWNIPQPVLRVFGEQDETNLSAPIVSSGGGGVVYDEISIFRWYQEDPLPVPFVPLGIDEEPWKAPILSLEGPKWLDSPDELIVPQPAPLQIEEDKWLPHEFPNRQPSAEGFIWVDDDEHLPFPIENERWPLIQPAYLGKPFVDVFSQQDEVFTAVRDEEPWMGPAYPLGPVVQVSDYSDDIVSQPPTSISVEETYWLQPDPPRDVVTGWQFPLDINEDFPELSTPPTPPRVEILGGDPVKKRKKSPREEIRDLLNAPSGEKIVLVPPSEGASLPEELRPVAKVVPAEYLPPIGVLPVSEPPPPAFSDEEMAEILALIHLGIL